MNFRRWFRWRTDDEFREEIRAHIELERQDLVDRGVPPDEARRAAMRTFGNPDRLRELVREADPFYTLDTVRQDVRFAVRLLRRTPVLALTIVVTLVLGIGLNSSVFTILNAFLFRPIVSREPDTFITILTALSGTYSREIHGNPLMLTVEDYETFRENVRSLSEVTASAPARFTVIGEQATEARGALVSCNFLSAHLDPPVIGRSFTPEDCARGGTAVAVFNETFWRSHFGGEASVVGRNITLNGQPFTVIGVAPNQLTVDVPQVSVWVPFTMQPRLKPPDDYFRNPGEHAWLDVQGRLRTGYTHRQAQAELTALATRLDEKYPGRKTTVLVTNGSRIQHPFFARRAPIVMGVLMGALTLILLIVCANVTMLLLSRAAARRQEMAIRLSLGAGRARLLRQMLIESLLLSLVAAAGSWWLAHYFPAALLSLSTDAPPELPLQPDWRVFTYTLAVAVLAGCAAGLSPAFESLRGDLISTLRAVDGARSGRPLSRLRGVLVTTQLAASLAVLAAAGLLVRAHGRLSDLGVGYDPNSIVVTRVSSPSGRDDAQGAAFVRTLIERVAALPGVRSIAVANSGPFQGSAVDALRTDVVSGPHEWRHVRIRRVSPEYFDILAVRVIRGRVFTAEEARASSDPTPVVISEALARALWGSGDPLGGRIHTKTSKVLHVVGVAADTSSVQPGERDGPVIYQPLHPTSVADGVLIVSATGSGDTLVPAIRETIRTLDPRQAPAPETIAAVVGRLADRYAFILKVGSIPTVLAFVLCLLGIYGVAAFAAAQRTREVGIRMALGARRQDIIQLLARSVALPLLVGLPIGVALGAGLGILFDRAQLLLGVSAMDPASHIVAALLIALTAVVATLIPARRAARLDPWRSLRVE